MLTTERDENGSGRTYYDWFGVEVHPDLAALAVGAAAVAVFLVVLMLPMPVLLTFAAVAVAWLVGTLLLGILA